MTLSQDYSNGLEMIVFARIETIMKTFQWTLEPSLGNGSNVYSHPLKASLVTGFSRNGTAWTAHSSLAGFATPTASRFFYDRTNQVLYADFLTNTPISASVFYTVSYVYCASTHEIIHYSTPNDSGTTLLTWFPVVDGFPVITRDVSDFNFGVFKETTSSIGLSYIEDDQKSDLLASRLVGSDVNIYFGSRASSGLIDPSKCQLVFKSKVESLQTSRTSVSLALVEKGFDFNKKPQNPVSAPLTWSSTSYPDGDSDLQDTLIPTVYGVVMGHRAFCNPRDDSVTASTHSGSENKNYSLAKFPASINIASYQYSYTVQASPAPTTRRIYLNTTQYLNFGDVIYSLTKESQFVINNVTSTYVDGYAGESWTNGNEDPIVAGDVLIRTMVGHRQTVGNSNNRTDGFVLGQSYLLNTNPDPNFSWDGPQLIYQNFTGVINTSWRQSINASTTLSKFKMYGYLSLTLPSSSSISNNTGTRSKWFQILYHYLNQHAGLAFAGVNTDKFTTLNASVQSQEDIGLVLPEVGAREYPGVRTVVQKLIASRFAHVYINNDFKIDFFLQGVMGSPEFNLTADDIIDGSVSYSSDYSQIVSSVTMRYRNGLYEYKISDATASLRRVTYTNDPGSAEVTTSATNATNFYGSSASIEVDSLLHFDADASTWASRGLTILGYPKNTLKFTLSLEFYDIDIGDVVSVDLSRMDFLAQTSTTGFFKGRVISKTIDRDGITLVIWDQIGIEQNQGVW